MQYVLVLLSPAPSSANYVGHQLPGQQQAGRQTEKFFLLFFWLAHTSWCKLPCCPAGVGNKETVVYSTSCLATEGTWYLLPVSVFSIKCLVEHTYIYLICPSPPARAVAILGLNQTRSSKQETAVAVTVSIFVLRAGIARCKGQGPEVIWDLPISHIHPFGQVPDSPRWPILHFPSLVHSPWNTEHNNPSPVCIS